MSRERAGWTGRCSRRGRNTWALSVLLGVGLLAAPFWGDSKPDYADQVAEYLQQARKEAGKKPLPREPRLDGVALGYARELARLPAKRRQSAGQSIDPLLQQAGYERYQNARTYMDFQKGFSDPVAQFTKSWRNYPQSFERWLGADADPIGLVVYRASDGWLMLVAVIVEGANIEYDAEQIARDVSASVNAERIERGLVALEWKNELAKVARAHSADMGKRDYFDHVSPKGKDVADRVQSKGLVYRTVGENIFLCRGYADPVGRSVQGWMDSPGHRKNILNRAFEEGGVGVHVSRNGTIYITQVFFTELK